MQLPESARADVKAILIRFKALFSAVRLGDTDAQLTAGKFLSLLNFFLQLCGVVRIQFQ